MPNSVTPHHPPALPSLDVEDRAALEDLFVRGTPENTLRAYERDLVYLTAWKRAAFGAALDWPEQEEVALRFILDHSRDLADAAGRARETADHLIQMGLRKSLTCPAPSTLNRRIASWCAFHRMRNQHNPFDAPLVRQARAKARKAMTRPPAPKSAHPITKDVLLQLLEAGGPGLRGIRDRAILLLGWASGGRRRSEIVSLDRDDIKLDEFDEKGLVWITLLGTKTTEAGKTPKLVLKGLAARALVAWIDAAQIGDGPLFRRITRTGALGQNRLSAAAVSQIVKRLLVEAGLDPSYASPHGLRSGFLTQAALDGAPLSAAMRLSLHRSAAQAQKYYDDVDVADNPATDLLGV
ncbi:site-specific integrase [Tropicibacter sp. R16_0]|uniref:site-specific integrase n=1 Tax=Tropicibacter sp. R16_0 TaxID=2821102 RepID=UPI001ADA4685|nr:site-specific integrase [Tropicibacter sp. R16_0]MBO9452912.1 site-specific integrase [Tropicibacter sp. R16_0]